MVAHPREHPNTTNTERSRELIRVLALCVVIACVAWVRLRLADAPLERDEGEYAYAGQLILRGLPPYELAYNMKFPGTYYGYAASLAAFGETARGVHLGLLAVNVASVVLVYVIARQLLTPSSAVASAAIFAALTLDRGVYGAFAHATHFVTLFAVAGFAVLRPALDRRRPALFAASGAAFGAAVLMKQHAILFVPAALALICANRSSDSRRALLGWAAWLLLGVSLPIAAVMAVLYGHGVLGRFYFWTFEYAAQYATSLSLAAGTSEFLSTFPKVTRFTWAFWLLALGGMVSLTLARPSRSTRATVAAISIGGALTTIPGLYFRPHYFVVVLPAVALLCGAFLRAIELSFARARPRLAPLLALVVPILLLGHWVATNSEYLFRIDPWALSRATYGGNPFIESPAIAAYIRAHTTEDDRIAVLGSEPQIYFYSGRKSATGYIYMYPLMERQAFAARMQDEMIREIESTAPKFVVLVEVPWSWLARSGSERIFSWAATYLDSCYDVAGIADISPVGPPTIVFDDDARNYTPQSEFRVYTFVRRPHCTT